MTETVSIPEGYVAFGWHSFPSGGLNAIARLSVAHLAPAEQGERPYRALCGGGRRGRSTRYDSPAAVAGELRRGERRACAPCFARAANGGEPLPRLSSAQGAMARAIYYMPGGVHRDVRTLARRAGTTPSGAARTLRSLGDHDLATESLTGGWSLTARGKRALDALDDLDAGDDE